MRCAAATGVRIARMTPSYRRAAPAFRIASPRGIRGRWCMPQHYSYARSASPGLHPATRRSPTRSAIACIFYEDRNRNRLHTPFLHRRTSQMKSRVPPPGWRMLLLPCWLAKWVPHQPSQRPRAKFDAATGAHRVSIRKMTPPPNLGTSPQNEAYAAFASSVRRDDI
jgi:hypothetical protein